MQSVFRETIALSFAVALYKMEQKRTNKTTSIDGPYIYEVNAITASTFECIRTVRELASSHVFKLECRKCN